MKPGKFNGGGMNMGALMKQAQKMQADMAKLTEELETREYTATAGGGAVSATVSAKLVTKLEIAKEAIDPDDSEMLCDMVISAVNSALKQAEEASANEMQKITGSMPGMF